MNINKYPFPEQALELLKKIHEKKLLKEKDIKILLAALRFYIQLRKKFLKENILDDDD